MTDLFYVFGIALTASALVVSFLGLRVEGFPSSRPLHLGVLAFFAVLVVGSCGFAIALSREEADERAEEIAAFEEEEAQKAEEAPAEEPGATPPSEQEEPKQEPAGEENTTPKEGLELTSPADGSLVFDPTALSAKAGEVAIAYTNPSPVPHNVAIEGDGETLAQGGTVSGGDTGTASAALDPGEYTYFCSIPGHRESGMEGKLTVK